MTNSTTNLESFFKEVVRDYCNVYKVSEIHATYSIVSDMAGAYAILKPELARSDPKTIASANIYNGLTVPPYKIGGTFSVLIKEEYIRNAIQEYNASWIGTIAHETTHVIDYSLYAKLAELPNYDDILEIDKHGMFLLWSEFNARAKGYYFTRKYTIKNLQDKRQVPDILNRELPYQYNWLMKTLETVQDGYMQAYYVVQYLGRLYTLQQLFPEDFKTSKLSIKDPLLRDYQWVYNWFLFLINHPTLEDAYYNFDGMKKALRSHFVNL